MNKQSRYVRTQSPAYRALSWFLSFALVLSGVPATAFAEEEAGEVVTAQEEALQTEDVATAGEVVAPEEAVPEAEAEATPDDVAAQAEAISEAAPEGQPLTQAPDESTNQDDVYGKAPEAEELVEQVGHADTIQSGAFPLAVSPQDEQALEALTDAQRDGAMNALVDAISRRERGRVDISEFKIPTSTFGSLYRELVDEHPEFWYVDSTYRTYGYPNITTVQLYYIELSDATIASMDADFRAALDEMVSWAPSTGTQAQKVKAVHDWLVRNCAYDSAAASIEYDAPQFNADDLPWTAYSALVTKKSVCQGYSLAFKAAMNRLGIECTYSYNNNANHMWNRVKADGQWYQIDVTHDDPLPDAGFNAKPSTRYFLLSDATLKTKDKNFHTQWTPSNPVCVDTRYDTKTDWHSYIGPDGQLAIESFELASSQVSLAAGRTYQLRLANVSPSGASAQGVTWQSSDTSVATVSEDGVVTAGNKAGSARVTCACGKITKSCVVTVAAAKTNVGEATVDAVPDQAYTGSPVKPTLTVTLNSVTLREGIDYTVVFNGNTNVGTATAIVTGMGGYRGIKVVNFKIVAGNMASVTISAIADQTYTGKALTPAPTVKLGSATLKNGTDYVLSYRNNINAGTAIVSVTGKGNYSGTRSVNFKIVPTSIAGATIEQIADQAYTGKGVTPPLTVTLGSTILSLGTDYAATYSNNVKLGTATVTVAGKGNFTGSKSATFKIVDKVQTQPMYRLYNRNSGEHFYTADTEERDTLRRLGWAYEGLGWNAPVKSNTPVYRLYNRNAGDHHYTVDTAERDVLVRAGWIDEGIGWYSDDAKGVALYRQYNPNAKAGSHNYTTDKAENDFLVGIGWKEEGIGWYGVK